MTAIRERSQSLVEPHLRRIHELAINLQHRATPSVEKGAHHGLVGNVGRYAPDDQPGADVDYMDRLLMERAPLQRALGFNVVTSAEQDLLSSNTLEGPYDLAYRFQIPKRLLTYIEELCKAAGCSKGETKANTNGVVEATRMIHSILLESRTQSNALFSWEVSRLTSGIPEEDVEDTPTADQSEIAEGNAPAFKPGLGEHRNPQQSDADQTQKALTDMGFTGSAPIVGPAACKGNTCSRATGITSLVHNPRKRGARYAGRRRK